MAKNEISASEIFKNDGRYRVLEYLCNCWMIQDIKTGKYFSHRNGWVDDPYQATRAFNEERSALQQTALELVRQGIIEDYRWVYIQGW